MRTIPVALCMLPVALSSCEQRAETGAGTVAQLPDGTVAMVGTDLVSAQTVARIIRDQGVAATDARARAVRDALLAAAARERFAGSGRVASAERSALARALLERVKREVRAAPITDAELREVTARHWVELDRPAAARTTHVVVVVASPEQDGPARALAARIGQATAGAQSVDEFTHRAEAVPAGSLQIKVERLPPVTAEGRTVVLDPAARRPGGQFDPDFARAANALQSVGDQSPVVKSKFGYHVIRLEERVAEKRVPADERRQLLRREILDDRARRVTEELAQAARQREPVTVTRAADDLTRRVEVQ